MMFVKYFFTVFNEFKFTFHFQNRINIEHFFRSCEATHCFLFTDLERPIASNIMLEIPSGTTIDLDKESSENKWQRQDYP